VLKPPKILILVENNTIPDKQHIWTEAMTLRDQGFQVSIISPKGETIHRESYICLDNIHIYRYSLSTGSGKIAYILEYSLALLQTFRLSLTVLFRHGFDIIQSTNPPDIFFLIGLFYKLFGKKFIFEQHDPAPEMFQVIYQGRMSFLHKLLLFCEYCSYKTSDLVFTSSISQQNFALQRGHCPPEKVFLVRTGPDLQTLQQARKTHINPTLKRGRKYLLAYVGVMNVQDGVENALYALHDLVHKRGRQDVSLILIGKGDHRPTLEALAHKLQLEEYVNFTGWLAHTDVLRCLATADIGIIPDPKNGLSEYCTLVKTMEYMGMGKPIVAFDLFETRYSAGDAALYAQPNLTEDLANKIEILLNDETLRLKMGTIGRQRVEEELCWDQTKLNLLLAYQKLFPHAFVNRPLVSTMKPVLKSEQQKINSNK
jgi:glycosyltransferase involved in cell wall biosynthesis